MTLAFDNTYARLPSRFYARQSPVAVANPRLVKLNQALATELGLDYERLCSPEGIAVLVGNTVPAGAYPLAMAYAGHQFGSFVPQLGDGRAILLGEVLDPQGERFDIQLKGSGRTPFSRAGDGRAWLGPVLREYIVGEAMHALGIRTTRALAAVATGEPVFRETALPGAVLTRVASSHVRIGTFEYFAARGDTEAVGRLADYVIARHFPDLIDDEDKYQLFLNEVTQRTAKLMAQWQAVGFSHGVMNTDNMSILGLTFDYGPFGFMENYDPGYICNHSDPRGRYAYDQQPQVGLWNLACLAHALSPLIPAEQAHTVLDAYAPAYHLHYAGLMSAKLGLNKIHDDDIELIGSLLSLMHASRIDYTNLFRNLGNFDSSADAANDLLRDQFIDRADFDAWAAEYRARLQHETSSDNERKARMDAVNPKYVLRNYLAQNAIEKAELHKDFSEIDRLLHLLGKPFDEQPEMESYAATPPEWGRQIEVSCSS